MNRRNVSTLHFDRSSGESANSKETLERKSTRLWASENDYDAEKLLTKFFAEDIKYLLSMENLWKKRKPPTPLDAEVRDRVFDGAVRSGPWIERYDVWIKITDVTDHVRTDLWTQRWEVTFSDAGVWGVRSTSAG